MEYRKQIIKKLFWDRNIDPDHMLGLIDGKPELTPGERTDLYRRFLTSCDWYTLLQIFPNRQLRDELLDENVITRLYPKELIQRYRYARKILSE